MKISFAYWTVALTGGLAGALGCNGPGSDRPVVAQERHVLPPPVVRHPMHQPSLIASAVDSAPVTGATAIAGAVVDARALIITADGTDAAFAAIRATLQYLGSPFDVLNATTGPALTADTLASGTHGKYDAVFLDLGGLETSAGSAFTADEWATLSTYEAEFSVRRVALYTSPGSAYGLSDNGAIDPTQAPVTMTCTAAGTSLFVGTNCTNPIALTDGELSVTDGLDL